jgi:hypothetical protein
LLNAPKIIASANLGWRRMWDQMKRTGLEKSAFSNVCAINSEDMSRPE